MVNVVSKLSGLKQHNFLERRVLIRSCDIIQGGENRKLGGVERRKKKPTSIYSLQRKPKFLGCILLGGQFILQNFYGISKGGNQSPELIES